MGPAVGRVRAVAAAGIAFIIGVVVPSAMRTGVVADHQLSCIAALTAAETESAEELLATCTFAAADPLPTATKRTFGWLGATASIAATSTGPTAATTPHCCCTSVFTNGVTEPTVSTGTVAARNSAWSFAAFDAFCTPAHTGAAAAPTTPCGPVSRHTVNVLNIRSRAGGRYGAAGAGDGHNVTAMIAPIANSAAPLHHHR